MKLYMEPVEMLFKNGSPLAMRWRSRVYRVKTVADRWTYRGRWWTDPLRLEGERRTYYRLVCEQSSFEIFVGNNNCSQNPLCDFHTMPSDDHEHDRQTGDRGWRLSNFHTTPSGCPPATDSSTAVIASATLSRVLD